MMKRSFTALCVLALTLHLAAGADAHAQARRSQPIEVDRIVAIVNDEAITAFELKSRLRTVERQLRQQNVELPPADVLERQLLDRMITDRAQLQFAKETGLRVSDIDLDGAMRRIAEGNKMSLVDFRAALEKDGIQWPKFREEIRDEMTLARLREREVENRIVVSDGEIDNYLAGADQVAVQNVEVQIAHIVIRVPEQASPDQLMRIGARAQTALNQIRAGEDFAKVAASFSDVPDGLKGGLMDPRPIDRLPTLYADSARQLKPGDVSDILRSPAGFHIVKLIDRRGGVKAEPEVELKQTKARHILIKVNELVSEAEAKRKLVVLKERILNGGDFAELARLNSNDLSAAQGGDLGWLAQGMTVPEFERAMDALKINEISEPVQSPFGFHLIQVLERRIEDASKDRKRNAARQILRDRKSDEAYQDWVRQTRDRAFVENRIDDR